jgi:HD superfamily phosphodiesterase
MTKERSSLQIKAIKLSEDFAKKMNTVAHHFNHADQVRNEAVSIGLKEGLDSNDLFLLEIAALWHDVGLDYVKDRKDHPQKSSDMFLEAFDNNEVFTALEKNDITFLLLFHDKYSEAKMKCSDERVLKMLRILIDADTLELLGEIGFQRAVETQKDRNWSVFDPNNPKGETYEYSSKDFDKRFKLKKENKVLTGIEPTLVGQLNFQISCADLLYTASAKTKSIPGVKFLKDKIQEIISV